MQYSNLQNDSTASWIQINDVDNVDTKIKSTLVKPSLASGVTESGQVYASLIVISWVMSLYYT